MVIGNVPLPAELDACIDATIASAEDVDASDVVRDGVRRSMQHEACVGG